MEIRVKSILKQAMRRYAHKLEIIQEDGKTTINIIFNGKRKKVIPSQKDGEVINYIINNSSHSEKLLNNEDVYLTKIRGIYVLLKYKVIKDSDRLILKATLIYY